MSCGQPPQVMGLTETAIDVLRALPTNSLVCADGEDEIVVRVPPSTVLKREHMSKLHHHTIVELDTCLLRVLLSEDKLDELPTSPRPCTLTACTVSERQAADMANEMGCIDLDQLVPNYTISTSGNVTSLRINRLLKIDDECLAKYMSTHATGYEYSFRDKQVRVFFDGTKKRKSRE